MSPSHPRRCALVTGAAKRLGRSIALHLAASGWDVAIHYRHSAAEAAACAADCRALGVQAEVFSADLADEVACRALVPAVVQHFGRLDAVVNNASTFEHDSAQSFSYAAMDLHWRSNTGPAVLLAQALHQHLSERVPGAAAAGAVVNLLDQKLWNPNPDFFSYTLSKAALQAATTLLALALAPQLRIMGVAPGLTLSSHLLSEEQFARLHRLSPLGQSSNPEDVAEAVRFVLDNRALTGSTLLVDGGQHLWRFERDFSHM